jgi:hypothetical protein
MEEQKWRSRNGGGRAYSRLESLESLTLVASSGCLEMERRGEERRCQCGDSLRDSSNWRKIHLCSRKLK